MAAGSNNRNSSLNRKLFVLLLRWKFIRAHSLSSRIKTQCRRLKRWQKKRLVVDWFDYECKIDSNHILFNHFVNHQSDQSRLAFDCSKFLLMIVLRALSLLLTKGIGEIQWVQQQGDESFIRIVKNRVTGSDHQRGIGDYLNDNISLDTTEHGIQQARQFLQKLRPDRIPLMRNQSGPLLPDIAGRSVSDDESLVNVDDATTYLTTETLVNDHVKFEGVIRDLFVEWIDSCRQMLVENMMKPIGGMDINYEQLLQFHERDISMMILAFIPSQLHVLSFILDPELGNDDQLLLLSDDSDTTIPQQTRDKHVRDVHVNQHSIRVLIKFIRESTDSHDHRTDSPKRCLSDIENDITNLLSRHPVHSVIYSSLYSKELPTQVNIDNWMHIYKPQPPTQHSTRFDTIITRINSILHSIQRLHTTKRLEHDAQKKSINARNVVADLTFDAYNYDSEASLTQVIEQALVDRVQSEKEKQLAQALDRSLTHIEELRKLPESTLKDVIFKEEWDNYVTKINREREKRRRQKYLEQARKSPYSHLLAFTPYDHTDIPIWKIFHYLNSCESNTV